MDNACASTREAFQKLAEKEGTTMKFMAEEVVPAMITMLGDKPFDPTTKTGFGCFSRHTPEQM